MIAERYRHGETLTEIARSFRCTAPAIRYIVSRSPAGPTAKAKGERLSARTPVGEQDSSRNLPRIRLTDERGVPAQVNGISASSLWARVNNDIATFLAAIDALTSDDNDENYETLLNTTDRLLWGSARTRLEIEEILKRRREQARTRRMSG